MSEFNGEIHFYKHSTHVGGDMKLYLSPSVQVSQNSTFVRRRLLRASSYTAWPLTAHKVEYIFLDVAIISIIFKS